MNNNGWHVVTNGKHRKVVLLLPVWRLLDAVQSMVMVGDIGPMTVFAILIH